LVFGKIPPGFATSFGGEIFSVGPAGGAGSGCPKAQSFLFQPTALPEHSPLP